MNGELGEYATQIDKMEGGKALDEEVAKKLLGFKRSTIFRQITDEQGNEVAKTNWLAENGKPVLVPPVSHNVEMATVLLEDLGYPLEFSFDGEKYYSEYSWNVFVGKTLGEVLAKRLLFELEAEKHE
ncbi:hypothetical protein CHL76_02340 [Marinococcus halophilus]|uniref:Phage ABA sandwich domain-containing protein n=1 Tax=Marinococcus halophilus TaxID=1371 RepID=A0A510Y1J5_MARHA|nr:hypothetical protein [Marinococcus halophilus]OZT81215.1 hypothetical protein CHL76_02340 [Marinococcus halophilus]GEK57149.1 hypothetical protein MHA01_00540 [Marinococcus halophilus]